MYTFQMEQFVTIKLTVLRDFHTQHCIVNVSVIFTFMLLLVILLFYLLKEKSTNLK